MKAKLSILSGSKSFRTKLIEVPKNFKDSTEDLVNKILFHVNNINIVLLEIANLPYKFLYCPKHNISLWLTDLADYEKINYDFFRYVEINGQDTDFFDNVNLEQNLNESSQEYDDFFMDKLAEFGVESPEELTEEEKKKFFNEIKSEWK